MAETRLTMQQAISLFGDTKVALANALGITRQAINKWPDLLTERQTNEVIGAAIRAGKLSSAADLSSDRHAAA